MMKYIINLFFLSGNNPDDEMFVISEYYWPQNRTFDMNKLFRRAQFKDLVKALFFQTFDKYSDYTTVEPYFLKDW